MGGGWGGGKLRYPCNKTRRVATVKELDKVFQDHVQVREFCYKSVKMSFFEKVRENQSSGLPQSGKKYFSRSWKSQGVLLQVSEQELSEANHRACRSAGEKLNISPLDIGHK